MTRFGDNLYIAVEVTDDVLGTKLDRSDCKRHWRTDSVELAIDPDGRSENTSTTFKTGILPATAEGGPCFERDADNHQGPGAETAPGMEVASKVSSPYTGYVVETKIPVSLLPSTIDPQHLGFNAFVYDSDTQDKTGQTRIGWSTFGGVQGDPYRWGVATTPGWTPPAVPTKAPVIPTDGLLSVNSPQTIAQSVRNGVPIAGGPAAEDGTSAVATAAFRQTSSVRVRVDVDGPGEAHVFVVGPAGKVRASTVADLDSGHDVPAGTGEVRAGGESRAHGVRRRGRRHHVVGCSGAVSREPTEHQGHRSPRPLDRVRPVALLFGMSSRHPSAAP